MVNIDHAQLFSSFTAKQIKRSTYKLGEIKIIQYKSKQRNDNILLVVWECWVGNRKIFKNLKRQR